MASPIFVLGACLLPLLVLGQNPNFAKSVTLTCGPSSMVLEDWATIAVAFGTSCAAAPDASTTALDFNNNCEIICAGGTPVCSNGGASNVLHCNSAAGGRFRCGGVAGPAIPSPSTLCGFAPVPEPEPEAEAEPVVVPMVVVPAVIKGNAGCGTCPDPTASDCDTCNTQRQPGMFPNGGSLQVTTANFPVCQDLADCEATLRCLTCQIGQMTSCQCVNATGAVVAETCPTVDASGCASSSSEKSLLLLLLLLLLLIPLLCCCCALLLCCLRRKQTSGPVPFATFDPQAAAMAGVPCPTGTFCPSM